MKRKPLFILVVLVLIGVVGLVLSVRPPMPNTAPSVAQSAASPTAQEATQPLTLTTKPVNPPSLGLPQTAQGSEAAPNNEAEQEHDAEITLAAGPSGPLPPDLPTILLTDRPIEPSPLTGGVWNLPYVPPSPDTKPEFEIKPAPKSDTSAGSSAAPAAPALVLGTMPTPTLTFNAMDYTTNGAGHPPDTNGDVGLNHYMEAVNTSIGIYTKTTGAQATAFTFNSFWLSATTSTACDTSNQGDPIVLYDTIGQRWIFMDFAWTDLQNGPYYFCFGVSQSSNPLGNYWRYAIRADDAAHPWLPDYPKGGVWPDGLYFSANMFDCLNASCSSASYKEARAYAFNLQKMEAGLVLTANDVQAKDTTLFSYFTLMPSNVRGTLPPANTPNYFVSEDQLGYFWDVFKFHVNYTTPASSTFTGPTQVSQASYVVAASFVPEPSPGNNSDSLADRMMFLNQYRKIGGAESVWVQHTTGTASASTPTGIQWAQINVTGGTISTTSVQQQIFNNGADGLNRFMGSLAVDKQGNAALGYTASSSLVAPDIRYVGRLASDPVNQLPQAETTLLPSVTRSVQTGTCGGTCTRWGDYSAMTVDPVDDCTFWYANMYFPVQGGNWVTRIGSFKFPSCGASVVLSATTTSVTSSVNPALFGQAVKFTATVAISGPGAGTPTGVVTFTIDGSTAGIVALSSGKATFNTSSLSVGSHPITVTYGGDANFNSSAGKLPSNQVVNKASTATAVASSQNPASVGQVVTFTATVAAVSPGSGTPTGVVTFTINGSTAGTAALSSGVAKFSTSSLSVGSHPITVTYGGNANFNGSAGKLTPNQTVNKASTTTAVASSQNPASAGQVVTFTATVAAVAPGSGTPTGVVTFTIDGSTASPSPLSSGVAKFATSSLLAGTHPVTVTYGGGANFTASVGVLIPDQVVVNLIYLPLILK